MIQHINDADLYYEEYGQGDRYILASLQLFDPNGKGWPFDLADEGFHVFLIQMRGYGQSTHIYKNYNSNWYDVWADDIWAFAQAQGIPHFLYTGQSDGAAIGWHLCFRHPEVLVGFAGLAPGPHSRENLFVTPPRQRSMETISNPDAREQMAQYQRQVMLQFAKKFADDPELREEFIDKAEKRYQWELNKTPEEKRINPGIALSQYHTDEELKKALGTIRCPILLFYGMRDAMLPLSRTFLPTAYIPGAKAIFYQDASHFVHYAYRDDIREEISRFADKAFERFRTCTNKNGSPQKQDSNK